MIYSVGNNLGRKLTGIEKAMINRLNLFKKNSISNKLIFVSWSPRLYLHAQLLKINQNDVFSLYDVLQDSLNVKEKYFNWINYWENDCNYTLKYVVDTNDIKIYKNGLYKMYVHFVDSNYNILDYINYFDIKQRKIRRDLYDTRGFLSCTKVLTTNQKVVMEQYYSPSKNVKFEKYYNPEDKIPKVQSIIYYASDGIKFFEDNNSLLSFAIETLYESGDLFLSDKNIKTSPIFNKCNIKIPVVAILHSTHVKNINNVYDSEIKNTYKPLFNNLTRYSGIIVSTQQQKIDVSIRINNVIPVYTIPVGYTENSSFNNENKNLTDSNKIISIARYSPEKQLEHQIELISKLVKDFPSIQLHLYGFGNEQKKYETLIKNLNLENNVFLRGFIQDLDQEIETAYLSLITSKMEGFNLGLLETIAKGIPPIGYDSKYGPSDLIINKENGFLISKNDKEKLYHCVKELLYNVNLRNEFSKACKKHANNFNENKVIDKWQLFFKSILG